ncbi:MAG: hypothetical protein MI919_18600 [Holophagales bacterium]|nr:hypothetical protein [Holophagales bacterium]
MQALSLTSVSEGTVKYAESSLPVHTWKLPFEVQTSWVSATGTWFQVPRLTVGSSSRGSLQIGVTVKILGVTGATLQGLRPRVMLAEGGEQP